MVLTSRFRAWLGLRAQLMLALGALGALLAAVITISLLDSVYIQGATRRTIENEVRLNRLANDVVIYALMCRRFEKDVFLTIDDRTTRDFYFLQWQGANQSLNAAIEAFGAAAKTDDDRRQAESWDAARVDYRGAFLNVKQAIDQGSLTTSAEVNRAFAPAKDQIRSLMTEALTVAQIKSVAAQQSEAALIEGVERSIRMVLLLGGVALLVALGWIVLFPARLMRPINALQAAVGRLTGGDLAARVGLNRADELGVLARGFDEMAAVIERRTNDIEAQRARAEAARAEAEAARAEAAARLDTIEEQRAVIREMSVPILPLTTSALVMPLVGALDTGRLSLVQEQALRAIERYSARCLILDITGVPIVDSQVAQGVVRMVQAGRLLGAEVVLVGIRPEVAQAVVGLEIRLSEIVTRATLRDGIAYVLRENVMRNA